jgi:hypothetical protein
VTRATFESATSSISRRASPPSAKRKIVVGGLAVGALLLGACGGDDDDDAAASTTTIAVTVTPTTVAPAPTTTVPPTTTTTIPLVTDGATVVIANASGINGAAGRMTDAIEGAGFTVGEATSSSDAVGQLETTQVYYDPDAAAAQAVAESVRALLGGGDIELVELGVPAPVESGDIGDATVLVMMGNDVADKTLAELQGLVEPATDEGDDATDDTTSDTTDDTAGG